MYLECVDDRWVGPQKPRTSTDVDFIFQHILDKQTKGAPIVSFCRGAVAERRGTSSNQLPCLSIPHSLEGGSWAEWSQWEVRLLARAPALSWKTCGRQTGLWAPQPTGPSCSLRRHCPDREQQPGTEENRLLKSHLGALVCAGCRLWWCHYPASLLRDPLGNAVPQEVFADEACNAGQEASDALLEDVQRHAVAEAEQRDHTAPVYPRIKQAGETVRDIQATACCRMGD